MFSYQLINRNREMNKHIELVKKWMADKDSVTQQELSDNRASAYAAYVAYAADAANAANDVAAANAAYAAYAYADADAAYWADKAAYWVKRYEELTK